MTNNRAFRNSTALNVSFAFVLPGVVVSFHGMLFWVGVRTKTETTTVVVVVVVGFSCKQLAEMLGVFGVVVVWCGIKRIIK